MRFFAGYLASRVSNDCKVYISLYLGWKLAEEEADDARGVICTQKREARSSSKRGNAAFTGKKADEARKERNVYIYRNAR